MQSDTKRIKLYQDDISAFTSDMYYLKPGGTQQGLRIAGGSRVLHKAIDEAENRMHRFKTALPGLPRLNS